MSEPALIYHPSRRPSIDYTTQEPAEFSEQDLREIQITRLQMKWFGAPPICFLPECRRSGQCRGDPQKGRFYLPPCFGHYREEHRFMVLAPGGVQDLLEEAGLSADAGAADGDEAEPLPEHLAKGFVTML